MRIARVWLFGTALTWSALAQDVPNIAEVRSILREASALVPDIEESQRGSAACNISGQQSKAGDFEGAVATIQRAPAALRDSALFCSSSTLGARGDWRTAVKDIEDLSDNKTSSMAYFFVAISLAQHRDYPNAIAVARKLLDGREKFRFADAMIQIYAKQFKAGDAGAPQTLNELLDAVETVEPKSDTPGFNLAGRYESLIQLAVAGGAGAPDPILERLYQMSVLEKDSARKQEILSHLAPAQASVGDFPGARRSADQLASTDARDKALLSIAVALADKGDPVGAQVLAGEISPKGWNGISRRQFGLALGAAGDYDGAVAIIEKEPTESRAESFGSLALGASAKSKSWSLIAAQYALDAAPAGEHKNSFPLQLVAVTRSNLGDFTGAMQIVDQLESKDRQWPLWNLTEQLVEAGRKNDALALARSQDDPYPKVYGLLGAAAEMLEQIDTANKKAVAK
jgi:tetratricopeptide (TPR) repeat protein